MGESNSNRIVEVSLRWPPFDPNTVRASELPIAREKFQIVGDSELPCNISIGNESGFHIHRKLTQSKIDLSDVREWKTLTERIPRRVERERSGWFLLPSKLHRQSRRLIPFAVVGIIASLAIHSFEPALVNWGLVDQSFAGSVRLGLLDYPILLLLFLPIFFIPIMMRLSASIWDFRRTRKFRTDSPQDPKISIGNQSCLESTAEISVEFPELREGWNAASAYIQVGLLNPRRPMLLHALGRKEGQQNPPGISTPLSIRQYAHSELGTGFGESTPLEGPDTKRLFLSPHSVQARGGVTEVPLEGGKVSLPMPDGNWPGSEYHPLIAVHWEVIIRIKRDHEGPLLFVKPLLMKHDGSDCIIDEMPTQSGRSELADS
mgnify:CR=1 FL=1